MPIPQCINHVKTFLAVYIIFIVQNYRWHILIKQILKNVEMTESTVSNQETKKVIGDFLEMGHAENIIAMFRHEPAYYEWVGELLVDERLNVRLGLNVMFEELITMDPENVNKAIPSLIDVVENEEEPLYRGEAISLLGLIGNAISLSVIKNALQDDSPQVREMAEIVLEEMEKLQ